MAVQLFELFKGVDDPYLFHVRALWQVVLCNHVAAKVANSSPLSRLKEDFVEHSSQTVEVDDLLYILLFTKAFLCDHEFFV